MFLILICASAVWNHILGLSTQNKGSFIATALTAASPPLTAASPPSTGEEGEEDPDVAILNSA